MLILAEELLLLALDDATGRFGPWSGRLDYLLPAALLSELRLRGRLRVSGNALWVQDWAPLDEELLAEAFAVAESAVKPTSVKQALRRVTRQVRRLRERLLDRLVRRGVLRTEEHERLWLFQVVRYPTRDGRPEHGLREHLRAVLAGEAEPDERTAALLALVAAGRLERHILRHEMSERAGVKLAALRQGDPFATAAAELIKQDEDMVASLMITGAIST